MKFKTLVMVCDGPDHSGLIWDIQGLVVLGAVDVAPESFGRLNTAVGSAYIIAKGTNLYAMIEMSDVDYVTYVNTYPYISARSLTNSGNTITAWVIGGIYLTKFQLEDTRIQMLATSVVECQHERVEMIFSAFCKKCDATLT